MTQTDPPAGAASAPPSSDVSLTADDDGEHPTGEAQAAENRENEPPA